MSTFIDPKTIEADAVKIISDHITRRPLDDPADAKALAEWIAKRLAQDGLLHPGGYVTTNQGFGILVENGHAVQRVAPGDAGAEDAQWFTSQKIDAPWVPAKAAG